jgi:hypothetical protein
MATIEGSAAQSPGTRFPGDIVEIGLLLPADWADSLVEISKHRHQTVAQLIRGLIGRALNDQDEIDRRGEELTTRGTFV